MDPSIVNDFIAEEKNKDIPSSNEPIIVPDSPNSSDDSVVFVRQVPASRDALKIASLNAKIAALKTKNRLLANQVRAQQPKDVIEIEDDNIDAEEIETTQQNETHNGSASQSGLELELDESWVAGQLKDLCETGDINQALEEMRLFL